MLGWQLGLPDGCIVGCDDGWEVGLQDGCLVGCVEGCEEGLQDGWREGCQIVSKVLHVFLFVCFLNRHNEYARLRVVHMQVTRYIHQINTDELFTQS